MAIKLSAHAFKRFWDLHAWAGVVAGLVLHVMFITGGITLFHEQLSIWEEPLAQRAAPAAGRAANALHRAFAARGGVPDDFWFYLPHEGRGEARVGFQDGKDWKTFWIDASADRLLPERERLAHFVYEIHFLWHDLTGQGLYTVAGLLAAALLLALVTGVLIHLKDLVRQFHQFRPQKSRRVLWSDMHKVLGVMGLPFQIMYAYTGAFIVLAPLVLKTFAGPVFGGDMKRANAAAYGTVEGSTGPPGAATTVLALETLAARAVAARPDLAPEYIHVTHHGRENGVAVVGGLGAGTPRPRVEVRLREEDGAFLAAPGREGPAAAARRWINGLHFAHFGGLPLRFLCFFLALAGSATILTGNWVWLARRTATRGNEVLARLTVGVGAGTFVALGALFLGSRLFPLGWAARGAAEELTFLGVLAGCIGWALVARDRGALWWRQLAVAACLFVPVPFLATRWSSAGLLGANLAIAPVAAVDTTILTAAVVLATSALLGRRAAARKNGARADREGGGADEDEGEGVGPAAVGPEVALALSGGRDA